MSKNLITTEAFADFCESKPADEAYNYSYSWECAVAQFLQSIGVQNFDLDSDDIPEPFQEPVLGWPRTFGALAKRLRSLSA